MAQTLGEVMTPAPQCLDAGATVLDAARRMRDEAIGDVLICTGDRLTGIVTDRDLVVRTMADGHDPNRTKVGDVASTHVTMLSPDDSVDEAVAMMRERAIRRIPVCEDGRPVGVVSIGDLALERDPESALADISAAPANA